MAGAPHLDAFLKAAESFIGLKETGDNTFGSDPRGKELWSLWGWNASGTPWCAIFVSACAQKAGIANVLIAKDSYAIGVQKLTVERYGGTWIDGWMINGGKPVTPIPGDIVTYGSATKHGHDKAKHVGIVHHVEGEIVHTIEGNSSDECKYCSYSINCERINAYVRPNWGALGDDISEYLSGEVPAEGENVQIVTGPLYQNQNNRSDMTLRQTCYLDSKYELSNTLSDISISVINYTTALGDIYHTFAPAIAALSNTKVDTSELEETEKIVVNYFIDMGYSAATAAAIAGCLHAYSDINSQYKESVGSIYVRGIAAWEPERYKIMKYRVGDDWYNNLSGQLEYLLYDIQTNFSLMVLGLRFQQLSKENSENAAEIFMQSYNSLYNSEHYINMAKKFAGEVYDKLIISNPKSNIIGDTHMLTDMEGNMLSAQYSVTIPDTLSQHGIAYEEDSSCYSYLFNEWNKRSPQMKLAQIWAHQGYPNDKGIAQIGGYYCCAVKPKFGGIGEVIAVTLEDSTVFYGIICDEKGKDAPSEWGHSKTKGKPFEDISLIEWERTKTIDGVVQVAGVKSNEWDSPGIPDWRGKNVSSITNYGKYTDVKWS